MNNLKKTLTGLLLITVIGMYANIKRVKEELLEDYYSVVVPANPGLGNILNKIATERNSQYIKNYWEKVMAVGTGITLLGMYGLCKSKYRIRRGVLPTALGITTTALMPLLAFQNKINNSSWF